MLGESILLTDKGKYQHFNSITFYPNGNEHFNKVSKEYKGFLKDEYKDKCLFITYEELFELFSRHCPDDEYKKWIDYLKSRYVFP